MENSSTGSNEEYILVGKTDKLFDWCHGENKEAIVDFLLEKLGNGENLQSWAFLARSGIGYVRCDTLGVYVVTSEFFDKNFNVEEKN